jgi:DegV family protein with EDD domain
MNVGIVTDSACSLPAELVAASEVVIVPMHVNVGGESYLDGEFSLEDMVGRLEDGVTTSGPGPGEVAKAVRAADRGAGVAVLTVSQHMSSTFSAARLAKMSLEGEHKVAIVDTGTAAGAQGLVVLAASKAARAGETLESVVATAESVAARVRLLATLPSLAHLARSGRVPGAAAWGAAWLGLNAMFEFRSGKVRPLRPARSPEAARQRIVEAFVADLGRAGGKRGHLAALHAMDKPVAEQLLAQASRWTEPATAFVGSFSSVMIVHTGPGLVGLAWWLEGP